MKYCPTCQNQYTDETLSFCLQDGAPLVSVAQNAPPVDNSWQEPATVISQNRQLNNPVRIDIQQPQQSYSAPQSYTQPSPPIEKKSRTGLIIALLGVGFVLVLGIAGAIGAMFYYNNGKTQVAENRAANQNSTPFGGTNSNVSTNSNANVSVANATPSATPTPKPTIKPAEVKEIKDNVANELDDWKSASEAKNLSENMSHYADTVDYYKGGKVPASKIRGDKQKAYDKYENIEITLENIKVTPDPSGEKATVVFDKTWDFNNDNTGDYNVGSVQQQVILAKQNGKWKIVAEKDLKVYYVDKP